MNLINSFKIELLPVTYNKINDKYHYQLYKLQKDLNLNKMKKYWKDILIILMNAILILQH